MSRNIANGRWFDVTIEAEHANLKRFGQTSTSTWGQARVQKGRWVGSGRYYMLRYAQRCPRNCCDDDVIEVLTSGEVISEVREEIRKYADILREAKRTRP